MQLVIATDIFGQTTWVNDLVNEWLTESHDVTVLSPYDVFYDFDNESEAYGQFTTLGGFDAYCKKIQDKLKSIDNREPTLYVGFSAGGAALWKVLAERDGHGEDHLIAAYPGQIRHHLDTVPKINCSLIFPNLEAHFDLSAVIEYLVTKRELSIIQNQWLHGYANPKSANYQAVASQDLFKVLAKVKACSTQSDLAQAMLTLHGDHKLIKSG